MILKFSAWSISSAENGYKHSSLRYKIYKRIYTTDDTRVLPSNCRNPSFTANCKFVAALE